MGLYFNVDRHEYWLDGTQVPSVTQILAPITAQEYRTVDRETMERAARLGQAVHKLIELDIAGTLDEAALDDSLRPYLAQWRQFRDQSGFKVMFNEQRVWSAKYGYAGTLDLAGNLNGRYAIIDAKRTAAVPRTAGPQTAAYCTALADTRGDLPWRTAARFALHLTPDRWRLVPFTDPNDLRVFLASLTLHNFMEKAA